MASDDLHRALLAEMDHARRARGRDEMVAALRAVVELHAPGAEMVGDRLAWHSCQGCDAGAYAEEAAAWPCSSIRTIAEALGVTEGDPNP